MTRYISRKMIAPADRTAQLAAQLAAYEDELHAAYALLWQKQAALDAATGMISKLMARLQTQPHKLEILAGDDTNSPL